MFLLFSLGAGVFWTLTYVLIIRQSNRDRTYGMPIAALCANLSWELIFAFIYPHEPIQRSINIVWFAFDLIILVQVLRYGLYEFPDLTKPVFYGIVALALITSFSLVLLISIEFHDREGVYTAFGGNLLMSVLFIGVLYRRRSLRGQSLEIALCKLIGTALASLAFYMSGDGFEGSGLMDFLYVSIFVYDLIYVGLVWRQQQAKQGLAVPAAQMGTETVARSR